VSLSLTHLGQATLPPLDFLHFVWRKAVAHALLRAASRLVSTPLDTRIAYASGGSFHAGGDAPVRRVLSLWTRSVRCFLRRRNKRIPCTVLLNYQRIHAYSADFHTVGQIEAAFEDGDPAI